MATLTQQLDIAAATQMELQKEIEVCYCCFFLLLFVCYFVSLPSHFYYFKAPPFFYEASANIETSGAQLPMPLILSRTDDSIVLTVCMHVVQLLRMEGGADAVNQAVAVAVASRDTELAALQRHAGELEGHLQSVMHEAQEVQQESLDMRDHVVQLESALRESEAKRSACPLRHHTAWAAVPPSGASERSGESMLTEIFQDWQQLFRTKDAVCIIAA